MALDVAISKDIEIEIVDPDPVEIGYRNVSYFKMSALQYIEKN